MLIESCVAMSVVLLAVVAWGVYDLRQSLAKLLTTIRGDSLGKVVLYDAMLKNGLFSRNTIVHWETGTTNGDGEGKGQSQPVDLAQVARDVAAIRYQLRNLRRDVSKIAGGNGQQAETEKGEAK